MSATLGSATAILNPIAQELASSAIGAVDAAITELPINAPLVQDATTTEKGTAIHQGSHNLVSVTGSPAEAGTSIQPTTGTTDDFYSCAYTFGVEEGNISKLTYLTHFVWNSAWPSYTLLAHFDLPKLFIDDQTKPAWGQAGYFDLVRTGYHFQLQVSAPLGFAGVLILSYLPPGYANVVHSPGELISSKDYDAQTFLNLPYVQLDIAHSTSADLTIPYMSETNYVKLNTQANWDGPAGAIFVWCLTEMSQPRGSNNNLTCTLYGALVDPDFQAPIPWSLEGRRGTRRQKVVAPPPDPEPNRFLLGPGPGAFNAANGKITLDAESSALAGEQTAVDHATAGSTAAIQDFTEVLRRWSIVAQWDWDNGRAAGYRLFQFNMGFLYGNLKSICQHFSYFRGSLEMQFLIVSAKNVQGRMQATWFPRTTREFGIGHARNGVSIVQDVQGPPPTLVLPFTSDSWRESVDKTYGRISGFVLNPLSNTSAGTWKVKIVCLVRAGPDFVLEVPRRSRYMLQGAEPQNVFSNSDDPVTFMNFERPLIRAEGVSHTNLATFFSRPWYVMDVGPNSVATKHELHIPADSSGLLTTLFAYYTGEVAITVMATRDPVVVMHTYDQLPKNNLALQDLMGRGAIFIPSKTIKTFVVPFYSRTPLRRTNREGTFGWIYVNAPSKCHIFMSLKHPNFFVPIPTKIMDETNVGGGEVPGAQADFTPSDVMKLVTLRNARFDPRCDLLLNQGIEPNPGPVQLVTRDRGIYKHYGVRCGKSVFHLTSENIAASMIEGIATPVQVPFDDSWTPVGPEVYSLAESYLEHDLLPPVKFNIDSNCETWAKELLGDMSTTQGSRLKHGLLLIMALCFYHGVLTYQDQAGIGSSITSFFSKIVDIITGGFESFVIRVVVKTVARIVCYLILYAHCPNLLTTGVIAVLLAMDVTHSELDPKLKLMLDGIVAGKFGALIRHLYAEAGLEPEDFEEPEPLADEIATNLSDQSPKPFNDWSTAAKNLKWWFEQLVGAFEWIKQKIFPDDICEAVDELEQHIDEFATTMALADEHICLMYTDKNYSVSREAKQKHTVLNDMLSGIVTFLSRMPKACPLHSRANYLLNRLQTINFEPTLDWTPRPEPVGIWISGNAGCGKSFLVTKLANDLSKRYGWTVYANPTGSNHMDGYTNQEVHVFDDFGQNKEEEDYGLICQLISSCPFVVPKAEVTAKGTPYCAKVVLITTNRRDFSSSKLFDSDALRRRFPFVASIRPKASVSVDGRLNLSMAMRTGDLIRGTAWQRDLRAGVDLSTGPNYVDFDYDQFFKEICQEIETRSEIVAFLNQGPEKLKSFREKLAEKAKNTLQKNLFVSLEKPDSFFDCEKVGRTARYLLPTPPKSNYEKCKFLVKEALRSFKAFLERNRAWMVAIGALGSVVTMASLFIPWVRKNKEQSVYDGNAPVRLTRNFQKAAEEHMAKMRNQGRPSFEPIKKRLVNLEHKGVLSTGLAIGGKEVVTYGHDCFTNLQTPDGHRHPIVSNYNITIDQQPMDLQICVIDTPTQFKSIDNFIYDGEYTGDGYLIWRDKAEFIIQSVANIHPSGRMMTANGTVSTHIYLYRVVTTAGSCGGVLVAPVGGNLKILGIHTAGNGSMGCANRLFPFFNQGKVISVETFQRPLYYQPRKTEYHPSPFFENPTVEPAVLSRNDPRLAEPIEDITKKAAQKYKGNTFNPPPVCYAAATALVARQLRKVVGLCSSISYEEACELPMDWSTSPGHKYQGRSKRELVQDPRFKAEVIAQLENPETYFTTYLKDELRPVAKVRAGKTRAIEACNFDYVMAYRMVCGAIYTRIYSDRAAYTGIAVGICPYLHFGEMLDNLEENCLCMDFSGFDGSLPPQLLETAVDVLASCHTDPELVRVLHKTVIYSTHLVSDEIWKVEGGMCSGAPCTSVVNSIANNIAAYTVALSLGADVDRLRAVSYGDDIILSSKVAYPLSSVPEYYSCFFGMVCTGADKSDTLEWVDKQSVTFLKRTPGRVSFYPMEVGVLDLQSMMDKIQWTRGFFDQQLESFCMELVLHGPDVYEKVKKHAQVQCPSVVFPSYFEMQNKMKSLMYNQGGDGTYFSTFRFDEKAVEDSVMLGWIAKREGLPKGKPIDLLAVQVHLNRICGTAERKNRLLGEADDVVQARLDTWGQPDIAPLFDQGGLRPAPVVHPYALLGWPEELIPLLPEKPHPGSVYKIDTIRHIFQTAAWISAEWPDLDDFWGTPIAMHFFQAYCQRLAEVGSYAIEMGEDFLWQSFVVGVTETI